MKRLLVGLSFTGWMAGCATVQTTGSDGGDFGAGLTSALGVDALHATIVGGLTASSSNRDRNDCAVVFTGATLVGTGTLISTISLFSGGLPITPFRQGALLGALLGVGAGIPMALAKPGCL